MKPILLVIILAAVTMYALLHHNNQAAITTTISHKQHKKIPAPASGMGNSIAEMLIHPLLW
jgi:hypothetical protein